MIKKLLFTIALLVSVSSFAQVEVEVKVNTISALLGKAQISGEYIITDVVSAELEFVFPFGKSFDGLDDNENQSGFGMILQGKYFINVDDEAEDLYVSSFLKKAGYSYNSYNGDENIVSTTKIDYLSAGFAVGNKWLYDSGWVVDAYFGVGRVLSGTYSKGEDTSNFDGFSSDGFDYIWRIGIGYRFGYAE